MPALKLTDDLGRTLVFIHAPRRVVSLVPSDTYNVIALGAAERLVGRTRYCESPEAAGAAVVGGTKDIDVDAVLALAPHLVLANQEENTRPALEALAQRVPVLVSLPRRVADGIAHLARLARVLDVGAGEPARSLIRRGYEVRDRVVARVTSARRKSLATPPAGSPWAAPLRRPPGPSFDGPARGRAVSGSDGRPRGFVPIWMDPLMTLNADTFGSDVLEAAGVTNVFGDRLRLYPLAADLGKSAPQDAGGRDVRYPRVTLDEVAGREPELVILPDEPHAFSEADAAVLAGRLPRARIVRVSGKDLFWYGAWSIEAIDRLGAQLLPG
ncbi:MAG TPA: helical backbone metal receptor [Kofleriaceae bacterium]|nr:helical backbone metal receptor [Kofleriaceae bacterium]